MCGNHTVQVASVASTIYSWLNLQSVLCTRVSMVRVCVRAYVHACVCKHFLSKEVHNVRAHMRTALHRNKDNRKTIIYMEIKLKNKLRHACQ